MNMTYITTKLQPLKSYPTYQFYATVDSKSINTDDVFRICILETFRWLRARLKDFNDLPQELTDIEPENYKSFSSENITSFSYTNGLSIDVIYVRKKGIWSFQLSEPDMGANLGTERERLPVSGRNFNTEISLRKHNDYVEFGVRTMCSEPSDTTADCEVFRPTVVKALAENNNIRMRYNGLNINGTPLVIESQNDLERFFNIYDDETCNLPIVLVADSKTETIMPKIAETNNAPVYNLKGGLSFGADFNLTVDLGTVKSRNGIPLSKEKPKKQKEAKPVLKAEPKQKKLPVFDYATLAEKLVGFAVVVFTEDKYFKQIKNKTRISLDYGDITVISRSVVLERYSYSDYSSDMKTMFRNLRSEINLMPKRKQYHFGELLFHSDAKLMYYHTKRHETDSLEEQCSIYRLENAELKKQIKEHSQHTADMQDTAEALRITQKKLDIAQRELEETEKAYTELITKSAQKESAYQRSVDIISFYKKLYDTAATFPSYKEDICDWIEENYSDSIILAPRAKNEMKKHNGALDITALCDGIVYLDAYVKFRRQELSEDMLVLYAERYHWEIQNCGKETLKMRHDDYTVTYNGEQYELDLHIKRGVKTEELIRIYFCWNDEMQKIIIGSMPSHLATIKQST